MTSWIDTVEKLEAVIGKTPAPMHLKVIDHLDHHALRWIAASPLAFAGFADDASVEVTLAGDEPGFVRADAGFLHLPLAALDDPAFAQPGLGFCSLFLAPGIGETLRVNGRVAEVVGDEVRIAVNECYVHCAKALIRSDFWAAVPVPDHSSELGAFVTAARFMAFATADTEGRADLSPKGDPAGSMVQMAEDSIWFADRPGNRRADSFRNILERSHVSAVLLVPSSHQVLRVSGTARLTADAETRTSFIVQEKMPLLAACISEAKLELRHSLALERACLWASGATAEIEPAKTLAAHVRLNRDKGLAARIAGAIVSIPGFMQKGLDKDYKSNLY